MKAGDASQTLRMAEVPGYGGNPRAAGAETPVVSLTDEMMNPKDGSFFGEIKDKLTHLSLRDVLTLGVLGYTVKTAGKADKALDVANQAKEGVERLEGKLEEQNGAKIVYYNVGSGGVPEKLKKLSEDNNIPIEVIDSKVPPNSIAQILKDVGYGAIDGAAASLLPAYDLLAGSLGLAAQIFICPLIDEVLCNKAQGLSPSCFGYPAEDNDSGKAIIKLYVINGAKSAGLLGLGLMATPVVGPVGAILLCTGVGAGLGAAKNISDHSETLQGFKQSFKNAVNDFTGKGKEKLLRPI
jgi:hypothetical protein